MFFSKPKFKEGDIVIINPTAIEMIKPYSDANKVVCAEVIKARKDKSDFVYAVRVTEGPMKNGLFDIPEFLIEKKTGDIVVRWPYSFPIVTDEELEFLGDISDSLCDDQKTYFDSILIKLAYYRDMLDMESGTEEETSYDD